MTTLRVGDEGVLIRLTVLQDGAAKNVSTASLKEIDLRKPNGTTVTYDATFTTDGTDGQLECVTEAGDLDQVGTYRAAACVAIGSWTGHSTPAVFLVRRSRRIADG